MKANAFCFVLVGLAGWVLSLPASAAEESSVTQPSVKELENQVLDLKNKYEEEARGEDPVRAMDASLRLWNHYRAQSDPEKARMWQERFYDLLRQRAEQGEPQAMVYLGGLYAKGNDLVPQDLAKAREWFEKAAVAGDPNAQYQVAIYYHQGIGGPKDDAKASEWFGKALSMLKAKADHGNAQAGFWVGQIYFQGLGLDVDYRKALDYYQKSAEEGDLASMVMTAFMYREGKGCDKNEAEALRWFTKAAQKGDVGATMELVQAYREGKGTEKNPAEAEKWLQKGIQWKDPYAFRTLGMMYADGEFGQADSAKALSYFKQAADKGDVYSALKASEILEKTEPEQAYQLLNRISDKYDVPEVDYKLALMEEKRGDSNMAVKLFERSAKSGFVPSMVKMGMYHLIPFSGAKWNPRITEYWWKMAGERGDREAASYRAWLLWGGGGCVAVILVVALLLLNKVIKRAIRRQEEAASGKPE